MCTCMQNGYIGVMSHNFESDNMCRCGWEEELWQASQLDSEEERKSETLPVALTVTWTQCVCSTLPLCQTEETTMLQT